MTLMKINGDLRAALEAEVGEGVGLRARVRESELERGAAAAAPMHKCRECGAELAEVRRGWGAGCC